MLNEKQQRFVDEYLIDLNATQAAIRAGYSTRTAGSQAFDLLKKPEIQELIAIRQQDRLQRVGISQDDVVRTLVNMLAADANDLVEYRRHCCRYCWGKGNKYQRTANEMTRDRDDYDAEIMKQSNDPAGASKPIAAFNERGGIGYDERKGPSPECPECFGDGVGKAIIKDTRSLSPAAKALYAGVKQTKDGIEVKMQSKEAYLQLLMRHAGMFTDKVEHAGKGGGPLQVVLTSDDAAL